MWKRRIIYYCLTRKLKKRQTKRKRGLDSLFVLDDSLDKESQFIDWSVVEQHSAIDSNDVIVNQGNFLAWKPPR